ncbi:putative phytosulfokines 4 [Juglans microcarpa x Juglans regia]|uniref:putative phytosulfokines 4 n=1 Tax=Juglans microcarpa x Juglans regia TaxID=2249226 RepID=UPI001B7F3288|nr:putative phytosulfokines 4 [Juglans microcarpa x Juglans regia]
MAKVSTGLLMIALLLCSSTLTYASRPEPGFADATPANTHHGHFAEAEHLHTLDGSSCEGLGEEECLERRTLAAHLDYIYTQKQKP